MLNHFLIHCPSWRNVLSVFCRPSRLPSHCIIGFLPALYDWIRFRPQSVQLQEEEPLVAKPAGGTTLEGWKVLLLWIPATCDLTATTVRLPSTFVTLF